ncbi:MAG: chromosome segregation protein SMC [Betaproteobacteria bacterium CG2_30_68_42]|nr:MAG: chromosome segregation protein SMC [Betaproteobacteria bacterium CG2_30_68_42]PJA57557.1 MAG: chromosome segregation protein SMC [Rhodocyclales bacterium CG_4_9_14_3_um_filter_68_10]
MRLTKIKLAGFKTFVDPTTLVFPGHLVGVVGPNGCGKSNVIDAVRWVLGESKASALRGESMQDVIFNGASSRKPVGRAMVELVFDNSLGRALGQWSQYAEIAVKRIVERDGDSSYFINNLHVRRRDVVDLFLGTGLGPRAYAIIEQGMISRIIEAKPEELRLFLEEAAGVTKYKERRRETENRLEDTRENLIRLQDIRSELDAQIERLGAQAEVASRYRQLQQEHAEAQSLLWLLKRNEARAERERALREVEKLTARLDSETARLRQLESDLETARSQHYRSSDGMHEAQSAMYAANAEVARCEEEIARARTRRGELETRLSRLGSEQEQWRARFDAAALDRSRWSALLENARNRAQSAQERHEAAAARLPGIEAAREEAESVLATVRRELVEAEQQAGVQEAHRANAVRAIEALEQRRARLDEECAALRSPEETLLAEAGERASALEADSARLHEELTSLQAHLPELRARHKLSADGERAASRSLTEVRARRDALVQLQEKVSHAGRLSEWMDRHGLGSAVPLWQALRVEPGWERALEAVLRERLAALAAQEGRIAQFVADPAPVTVALALIEGAQPSRGAQPMTMEVALAEKVSCDSPDWSAVLTHWLAGVWVTENVAELLGRRHELGAGERWVDREGRVLSRHALVLYAPDVRTHGVIERRREIEALEAELETSRTGLELARQAMADAEGLIATAQERLTALRRELQELEQARHAAQVDFLKLNQARSRYLDRRAQIERDLAEVDQSRRFEKDRLERAGVEVERFRELSQALEARLASAAEGSRAAELALREARAAEQALDRELQEALFSQRECGGKIEDIERAHALSGRELERLGAEFATARAELDAIDEAAAQARLERSLEARRQAEQELSAMRGRLDEAAGKLKELEEGRMRTEQGIAPLRDKLGDLQLKVQAAQLNEEQHAARLAEAGADPEALASLLVGGRKESALQQAIARVAGEIEALGPVNLAALEELESAQARKNYLDSQSADLSTAIATLEDAIRRIDRETREQLRETFDQVNATFGKLFPELFAGGDARLTLTGEEILDAGVQVMAHPPGKRNASIHLLSGGEKALTAIALVFALFQLNPAPFCMLDEVDSPLDDANTERFCEMVRRMAQQTQFVFISHNKMAMEMAQQLIGVTMQEQGVSRVVEVDIEEALRMREAA